MKYRSVYLAYRLLLPSLICVVVFMQILPAQNLVPNHSFEILTDCPWQLNGIGANSCPPWMNAMMTTADNFHECANEGNGFAGVPDNSWGYQDAHTGAGYAGIITKHQQVGQEWKEYILAPLNEPLMAGVEYQVTFFVSLAELGCGIEHIGALLSVDPPTAFTPASGVFPQIESDMGYLSDYENWMVISDCFIAEGGEQYITIGNFHGNDETFLDPTCQVWPPWSYYYVDDVSVIASVEDVPSLELGPPVEVCNFYFIDPGIDEDFLVFAWSTGEETPSITVSESGTYYLTVTGGCLVQEDSIVVTIMGTGEPVNIEEDTWTMCEGESLEIVLDPDIEEYTWQDGTHASTYVITGPGMYQVTLDDGCDVSSDQIVVDVISPPVPFTLGADQQICEGDEIILSLDPTAGDFLWQDNSTSPTYTIDEGGTYSVTISNQCGETSDEMEVDLLGLPFIELDDSYEICQGDQFYVEFDASIGMFLWQDGTDNNFYETSESGPVAVTVSNECGTISDAAFVEVLEEPVFDLGPDMSLCEPFTSFNLSLDTIDFADEFLWQDGSTQSYYEVTGADEISVTVSNACFSITDFVSIETSPLPLANIVPGDTSLCDDFYLLLEQTDETGSILWQDGSTNEELEIHAPGIYWVTVTNQCGESTDSVTIENIFSPPVPNLGNNLSLCQGQSVTLFAPQGNYAYSWQDGSSLDSFVVNAPGIYFVTLENQCGVTTDTLEVTDDSAPPQIQWTPASLWCEGQTLTLDPGIAGVTYQWSTGATEPVIQVLTPGVYQLTVSNLCGADISAIDVMHNGFLPVVDLGQNLSLCQGESAVLIPLYQHVDMWQWSDGTTGDTIVLESDQSTITVEVSNACGTGYDTLTIQSIPLPPDFSLGADSALCPGESVVLEVSPGEFDLMWQDQSTDTFLLVTSPGTYIATLSNLCGNSSDTFYLEWLAPLPLINLGPDIPLCPGEMVVLEPGVTGVEYLWQDGSMQPVFSTGVPQIVILTLSNACGTDADTLLIFENTMGPQIDLGPDINGCSGDTIQIASGVTGVQYLWQDGSTAPVFTASMSEIVILQVSNACGADADTLVVSLEATLPSFTLGPDTILCNGDVMVLEVHTDPGNTILWEDGNTSSSVLVSTALTTSVAVGNICGVAIDTISIGLMDAPESFDLGPDTTLCPEETLVLSLPYSGFVWQWQDGSADTMLIVTSPDKYALLISNQCGNASDTIYIQYDLNIPLIEDTLIFVCPETPVLLNVTQPFAAEYYWADGSVTPSVIVTEAGMYAVSVSTPCLEVTGVMTVDAGDDCFSPVDYYIPNVFSPNGDQVNDAFGIHFTEGAEIMEVKGTIYDRWGNLLFSSSEQPFLWDGSAFGKVMNPGVYIYRFEMMFISNGQNRTEIQTGDVTLIR